MDFASLGCIVRKVKGQDDTRRFVASSDRVDRMGDIIAQRWELKNFRKAGAPFLYGHDHMLLPVGKVVKIHTEKHKDGRRTVADVRFVPEELNPFAQQVKGYYDHEFLKSVSVGFMPKERKQLTKDEKEALGMPEYGQFFSRSELFELSAVTVPANPDAVTLGINKGFIDRAEAQILADPEMLRKHIRSAINWDDLHDWLKSIEVEEEATFAGFEGLADEDMDIDWDDSDETEEEEERGTHVEIIERIPELRSGGIVVKTESTFGTEIGPEAVIPLKNLPKIEVKLSLDHRIQRIERLAKDLLKMQERGGFSCPPPFELSLMQHANLIRSIADGTVTKDTRTLVASGADPKDPTGEEDEETVSMTLEEAESAGFEVELEDDLDEDELADAYDDIEAMAGSSQE